MVYRWCVTFHQGGVGIQQGNWGGWMPEQRAILCHPWNMRAGRESRGLAKPTFRVWSSSNCHTELTFTLSKSSQAGSLRTLQISGIHVFNKNFSSLNLFISYEWDSNKAFCRPAQRSLANNKGFEGSVWLEESFKNWRGTQCWSTWSGSCSLKKQVQCLFLIWGGTRWLTAAMWYWYKQCAS